MDIKELTPEQKEKARSCKSADELIALAGAEGVKLSDEQLEAISGGGWTDTCTTDWLACPTN